MKTYTHLWHYLAEFFLEWEMFQTKVAEKIKTHIPRPITFFPSYEMMWKNTVESDRQQITDSACVVQAGQLKARLHGSPRLINTVESMK